MTLVSSIIQDAYRETNIIPIGASANTAQVTEALRLYNGILSATYGGTAGERLNDWPLGNYGRSDTADDIALTDQQIQHPPINSRIIALNEAALTVYLTLKPQDGSRMSIADPFSRLAAYPVTLDAQDRPIEGAQTLLLDTNGSFIEWIYRADLGAWVRISDVTAVDENPFPARFDQMFIILLAMRLNPRYGRELDAQSAEILRQNRREFVARYLQSMPLEIDDSISWPFMSVQSYDQQRNFSSRRSFDQGSYPWRGI